MKIAVFYPKSPNAAWSLCQGIVNELQRVGHVVVGQPIRPGVEGVSRAQFEQMKRDLLTAENMESFDLIITSGAEHLVPWIEAIYGEQGWKDIPCPKLAWYHESFVRDDQTIEFDAVRPYSDHHFFPAIQDAEFHDQAQFAKGRAHWLPFGVDTEMFCQEEADKDFDLAFIGNIYEKRMRFLEALGRHHAPSLRVAHVSISDLDGTNYLASAHLLANEYKRMKVFFNLPAYSRLLVTKVYEVMACGTLVLTPMLGDNAARNMAPFKDMEHLVYYRSSNLPFVAQMMREWPEDERRAKRIAIAAAGAAEIRAKHTLRHRLKEMFAKAGVVETVQ